MANQFNGAKGQIQGGRDYQEDTCMILEGGEDSSEYLLIVCDGMGGHAGGADASQLAAKTFSQSFSDSANLAVGERMKSALEDANNALKEQSQTETDLKGMGTTLVAV